MTTAEKKIVSWSFSAVEQFRNCPRQFQAERVTKEIPYVEGAHQKKGKYIHKMFEDYIKSGRALPPELVKFKPVLDRIVSTWPNVKAEWRMAINKQFTATGYFDKDAWCRAQVDVWSVSGDLCRIADWKTGKRKYDYDQLLLNALLTMCHLPEIQRVKSAFFWTETGEFDVVEFSRGDWHAHWARFLPDVSQIERAHDLGVWQEKPSGLCNGWCKVESCVYWKPKKEKR